MTNPEKLKYIADYVHKELLKPLGFKRRLNTFNRKTEEGIIQVVNFQSSMYNLESPETTKIKESILGPMPVYGTFPLNFGAWVKELAEAISGLYGNPSAGFIPEYTCAIRARIGDFLGKNTWFSLDNDLDQTSTHVLQLVKDHGLPFLQEHETRERILYNLETQSTINFLSPTPLLNASIMYLHQGNKEKAQELFQKHYDQTDPKHSHRKYLEELAEKLGLEIANPKG